MSKYELHYVFVKYVEGSVTEEQYRENRVAPFEAATLSDAFDIADDTMSDVFNTEESFGRGIFVGTEQILLRDVDASEIVAEINENGEWAKITMNEDEDGSGDLEEADIARYQAMIERLAALVENRLVTDEFAVAEIYAAIDFLASEMDQIG